MKHPLLCTLILSGILPGPPARGAEVALTISAADAGRTFEGIGAVSAGGNTDLLMDYPEPYRSEILDFLFKPKFGAGFQHLKVEIGGGENSTCGAEPSHAIVREEKDHPKPRGYEFWLMSEARKRNPKIILDCLPWSLPAWCGGASTQNSADWYVSFLDCAKQTYGLNLDYVGACQNERAMNPDWVANVLRPTLDKAGYAKVKLHGPDQNGDYWKIFEQAESDPLQRKALDTLAAISYHIYGLPDATAKAQASGKPLWMSETTAGWANELQQMIGFYVRSRVTKFETWPPVAGCYEGNTEYGNTGFVRDNEPWSGHYEVYDAVWLVAHLTQFTEPGWKLLDPGCQLFNPADLKSNAGCITLKDPASDQWSLIASTVEPVTMTVRVGTGLATGPIHVWKSSPSGNLWKQGTSGMFVQQDDLIVRDGVLAMNLAANSTYSFTTTKGQKKGVAPHPAPKSARFPVPYSENFASYAPGSAPKWFVDQKGTFEVADDGRGGMCLKQIVPAQGTIWKQLLKPNTIFGDNLWESYELGADVKIIGGDVEIGGRLDDPVNLGYRLTLDQAGKWTLSYHTDILSSGAVARFDGNAWHHLKIAFYRNQLKAFIDKVEVASLADATKCMQGRCFLATTYDPNLFDNLTIRLLDAPLDRSAMTATATSCYGPGYEAQQVLDGDPETIWHSGEGSAGPLPQAITIAFGKPLDITRMFYVPRKSGGGNGVITSYNLFTSVDGEQFTRVASGTWDNTPATKYAAFPATRAAFFRLEATAGVNGNASAAEIGVYQAK
jgi:galactosylceramidase